MNDYTRDNIGPGTEWLANLLEVAHTLNDRDLEILPPGAAFIIQSRRLLETIDKLPDDKKPDSPQTVLLADMIFAVAALCPPDQAESIYTRAIFNTSATALEAAADTPDNHK